MASLEQITNGSKPSYPGAKFLNGIYPREELVIAWQETLEIIEASSGDPFVLFKNGKIPFIFKLNGDTSPEYVGEQFEDYIKANISSFKKYRTAVIQQRGGIEAEACVVPDFAEHQMDEIGIPKDRQKHLIDCFTEIIFNNLKGSIQGIRNWGISVANDPDTSSLILNTAKFFDGKINKENIEAFQRIISFDMKPSDELLELAKAVKEVYENYADDPRIFTAKMEIFISGIYAKKGFEIPTPKPIHSVPLVDILVNPKPEDMKIVKRKFPDLYEAFEADVNKIQIGEPGPFFDPFHFGQDKLEEISTAVRKNSFLTPEFISRLGNAQIHVAQNDKKREIADELIRNLKKRKLPLTSVEKEAIKQVEENSAVSNALAEAPFEITKPNIVDLAKTLDYLDRKLLDNQAILDEIGRGNALKVYQRVWDKAPYLGATNTGYMIGLKRLTRPTHARNIGAKNDLKEYIKADPEGYTWDRLYMLFYAGSEEYIDSFTEALNDEEIFSAFIKTGKKINSVGSAFALKLLGMWAKDDEKKIGKVVENLFKTDEDYSDYDQSLRMKLFLFVNESGADIDFVIRKLLSNNRSGIEILKKNHDADSDETLKDKSIFEAFDEEDIERIYKELFNNPKPLRGLKGYKKPADFDKAKSLKEIELEASISLVEPIYVDMSDCLPPEFKVKLFPVQKTSTDDFSWGVEISYRDFKNKPVHEKATGRFENLKFKFGFTGEFREIFEDISVLASHRYFVRDCAEANTKRISDKIRGIIDRKKSDDEEANTAGVRTSGALSIDISHQDKKDDKETQNILGEKNVKSNAIIRKIIDGAVIDEAEIQNILVFKCENLGSGKNIYTRITAEELLEWHELGDLKDFLLSDGCFVMTTLAHSQAAGFYVKGFEDEEGGVLYGICPKRPTSYSARAHQEYLSSGFNPVSITPYKTDRLGIKADGDVQVGSVKISLEENDDVLMTGMTVRESVNRMIAKKTSEPEFIEAWVHEQTRIFKIENPSADQDAIDKFIKKVVEGLASNKVLDPETVKLYLSGDYETERVFNQGVYKKLSDVFAEKV